MTERYDSNKKDELMFHALSIFHETMKKTKGNCSDTGAILNICMAMSLESVKDEEEVREILNIIGRNCLSLWREYRELEIRYRMGD